MCFPYCVKFSSISTFKVLKNDSRKLNGTLSKDRVPGALS
ncbi:hypothetical protein LEP1GSC036_0647 [Leptospira weilii str. 2006001853]|uniref:Uncharacterized protein n=1 Tax=Leptospira weilii str. 2006001853 TaxID=1001589 RepID=A0A828Z7W8_9LEPT|nr:hypothetical protein LEP1GSC036_0647 [Leptospira weilii str. 2006001853]